MVLPLMFLTFGRPGIWELLLVLVILLLLFGAKRLPELGRSLGKTLREFRNSRNDDAEDPPPKTKTESDT